MDGGHNAIMGLNMSLIGLSRRVRECTIYVLLFRAQSEMFDLIAF